MATLRLLVENVDEPPVFTSSFSRLMISEAAAVGTAVGSVSAHDPDATNSPVRYAERQLFIQRYRLVFQTVFCLAAGILSTGSQILSASLTSTAAQV